MGGTAHFEGSTTPQGADQNLYNLEGIRPLGGVSPPRGGLEGRVKTVGVLLGGNTPCRGRIPSKSKDTPLQMGRYAPPRGGHRPLREGTPPRGRTLSK